MPAADWPALQLQLQPAVTLLQLNFNTPLIWKSLMDQQASQEAQTQPQMWLVYRR
jgi:hypothetical protein